MVLVQVRHAPPEAVPGAGRRGAGKTVELPARQVPPRMARGRVQRQRTGARQDGQRAEPDAEAGLELEGLIHVVPEEDEPERREVEGVAVQVLEDEWKLLLARVLPVRFPHRACGRIPEEGAVVRLP